MDCKIKTYLFFVFSLFFTVAFFASFSVSAKPNHKYASIVLDAESKQVISERYADKKLHPASLTKMMTVYMVFDALQRGEWSWQTRLYVSQHAQNQVPSKLGVRKGERITVEDAVKALIVKSANDVAVVVAENYAGSERAFATEMTRAAKRIGMSRTVFRNASGLHHAKQVSTARDMAVLGLALMEDFPQFYDYFSLTSFRYKGKRYRGHNALMKTYPGMDGLKTGYTRASGFNLVSSAKRNGKRLIGVVFGGKKSRSRNRHMAALLDQGFRLVGSGVYMANNRIGTPPIPSAKPTQALTIAALDTNIDIGADDSMEDNSQIVEQGSASIPRLAVSDGWRVLRKEPIATDTVSVAYKEESSLSIETQKKIVAAVKALKDKQAVAELAMIETAAGFMLPDPKPAVDVSGDWGVQVGAFNSRIKSDQAIRQARSVVPHLLSHAKGVNHQTRHKNGTYLYRARLTGLDKKYAQAVCEELQDCLVVAP